MSAARVTRIAPTPSGYLHLGNAVNFALIALLASRWDAESVVRIDDMDSSRSRSEYVDDIFATLEWLEIEWAKGPRDRADFEREFTMAARIDYYRSQLDVLDASGLELFACACSRADLAAKGGLRCAGECRSAGLDLATDQTALRLHIPDGTTVEMSGQSIDLAAAHGDVVLWRRDGVPAYHLASVIEDRDLGITDIVRGADLLESSALHDWLAPHLGADDLARANFVHHALVMDDSGAKLSKSQLASGPLERTQKTRDDVRQRAAELADSLGY